MESEASLAQDLCARLCHDLVGPLGTVAGALDMLADDPEAAELARDAAAEIRRRLKFWRVACGGGTGPLAGSEILALSEGLVAGGRARLEFAALAPEEVFPPLQAQMVLLAIMLAGEALPRGGVVRLERSGTALALAAEGRVVAWPAALAAALGGEAEGGPREAMAALLLRLAREAGWVVVPAGLGEPAGLRLLPPAQG
ncbi:histidine phosphotransferase family protein [Roseomonas sp. E05]|uniref:histidine phosphotransferase family protein n=1 Tax=Roseomonas sp. E05 TaxID=3046310 RepID=UPI0024BBAC7E|nr:histidine phosphotransferase family protein [Roseomonas sp. E05]MDJ0388601.1 histidine phosphotransferase family protein [Roseomonas sp. E05]